VIQGFGTGFIYVPIAAVTFSTLSRDLRNEATSVFNLMRNIGSSIGISVVEALLVRNTQIMHSALTAHVTQYTLARPGFLGGTLAMLNRQVTEQAAMIAYNDDFKLMMILTLCLIPCVFLLRTVPARQGEPVVIE
jgi:DHA2 family multidrug resistance protein